MSLTLPKELPFPVYLTSCSALSSDHLPILIDNACRSAFHHPPNRANFKLTNWANFQNFMFVGPCIIVYNFQTHLEVQIPYDPQLRNGMVIDKCVENFFGAILQAPAASTTITAGNQDDIRLKNRLQRR
jgi:hypothetical protein